MELTVFTPTKIIERADGLEQVVGQGSFPDFRGEREVSWVLMEGANSPSDALVRSAVATAKNLPREVEALPDIANAQVKAEAARRIESEYPIWHQLNIIREGGTALTEMSAYIDHVRLKSDEIEAMSPIPIDFAADSYWD